MKPSSAYMKFTNVFLNPRDHEAENIEAMFDFPIQHSTAEVRAGTIEFLEQMLATSTDEELLDMWRRSNARVGPGLDNVRSFVERVLARLRDPSVPSKVID